MPYINFYIDNNSLQEFELNKERTILGRRPDSDVIISDIAVSGRHACLIQQDRQVTIEDLDKGAIGAVKIFNRHLLVLLNQTSMPTTDGDI